MRIHTDNLGWADLSEAFDSVRSEAPHVTLNIVSQHGSRSHRQAFEVNLRGHGDRHTRRPNTGTIGANSDEYAATHDDWGWFLSAIYRRDVFAKVGPYKSMVHFHRVTKGAYLLP